MNIEDRVTDLIRNPKTTLPTLPVVTNNIIVTARSAETSAKDLANFIINDQAISTRVMKIANSSYYGMSQEVDSISRAIVVIGFKEILSLALGMSVFSALSSKGQGGLLDMTELWKHSIAVGLAMKKVAKKTGRASDESTVLVGLLHDVGKIIFSVYFPDEYGEVLKRATTDETPLHKLERKILGLDHAEMGYRLMEHWNFPAEIAEPLHHHHNPSECPDGHMALVVNMANFVAHKSGIGQGCSNGTKIDREVLSRLRLPYDSVVALAKELESERAEIEGFLEALS